MADSSGTPPPTQSPPPTQGGDQSQPSTRKKGRRATRLRELNISRSSDQKLPIQFDMQTGRATGEHKARFTSYVALLGRSKVSILIEDWDHVPETLKNQIWQSILVPTLT